MTDVQLAQDYTRQMFGVTEESEIGLQEAYLTGVLAERRRVVALLDDAIARHLQVFQQREYAFLDARDLVAEEPK